MTKTKWSKSVATIGVSFFALGLTAPVFAPMTVEASSVDRIVDTNSRGVATKADSSKSIKKDANGNQYYSPDGEFSNVNAVDVNNWAKAKGGDAVGWITTLAEPLSIIIFIASAIMMAVGALSKGDWLKRGIFGMALAVIMWTAVVFAPDLIHFFSEWLSK